MKFKIEFDQNKLFGIIAMLYVFMIFSLPDGIRNQFAVYKMSTKRLPLVNTFNYYFTILEIPILISFIFLKKELREFKVFMIIFAVLLLNLFYSLFSINSIFTYKSYEMFLIISLGYAGALITSHFCDSLDSFDRYFDIFMIGQFALQLLGFKASSITDGRIGAIGMGTGATANIAGYYLIWNVFVRRSRSNNWCMILAVLSILLSGSRTNLYAVLIIMILSAYRLVKRLLKTNKGKYQLLVLSVVMPVLAFVVIFYLFKSNSRLLQLFEGNLITNITEDDSYLGRLRSIEGSIQILKKNPLGIPFSMYAIEKLSYQHFTMEYPHSTFLSYLMLWSPWITLPVVFIIIKYLFRSFGDEKGAWIFMIYFIIINIFYGSPIFYPKSYLFTFIIFIYIKRYIWKYEYRYLVNYPKIKEYLKIHIHELMGNK